MKVKTLRRTIRPDTKACEHGVTVVVDGEVIEELVGELVCNTPKISLGSGNRYTRVHVIHNTQAQDVDDLFQWFDDDEVIPPSAVPIPPVNAHAAQATENAIGSPSTTVISEGAPAVTESLLPHQIPLPDTSDSDVETLFDHVDSNVFDTYDAPEADSVASSSNSVNIDVTPNNQLPHVQKWTQAHPLENIIGDKDRPVSTRKQLETDAMWCFFNEFLTHVD
ncbi:hypothetical protein Tco_0146073 [Tanacetum coccineum]